MNKYLLVFNLFLLNLLRFFLKHSRKAIVINILLFVVLFSFLFQLKPELSLDGILKDDLASKKTTESLLLIFEPKSGFLREDTFCQYSKWKSDFTLKNVNKFDFEFTDFEQIRRADVSNHKLQFLPLVEIDCQSPKLSQRVDLSAVKKSPWSEIFLGKQNDDILLSVDASKNNLASWKSIQSNLTTEILSSVRSSGLDKTFKVYVSGKPAFEHFILEGLKQILFLNLLFTVVLIFLFRLFFGSFKLGLISIVPFSIAGIFLYGLMGLFHQPINILMSIAYLIISLAALQDFLFLAFSQVKGRQVWVSHFTSYMLPGFFTSLTTMIGFGSLCISEIPVIRQFGVWTAIGSIIEWYSLFLFFPCMIKQIDLLRTWTPPHSNGPFRLFERVSKISPYQKTIIPFCILFVLGGLSLGYINLNDSPDKVFPNDHIIVKSSEYLNNSRGWSGNFQVNFINREKIDLNTTILNQISQFNNIKFVENSYLNLEYLLNTKDKEMGSAITRVISAQPYYLKMFPKDSTNMISNVYVKNIDLNSLTALRRDILDLCKQNCSTFGEIIDYVDFASKAPKTLIESLGLSVLLVGLALYILAVATNQKNMAIPLIISSFWGVGLMVLVIALFQIEINFLTAIFSSILVGICGDNVIQFLLASRKKNLSENIDSRGPGALIIAFIMFCAGLSFVASYFQPVRVLGILLSFGLLSTLIGDLWGLRLLINEKPQKGSVDISRIGNTK